MKLRYIISLMVILQSSLAFCEVNDGVIFDENGLTLIVGKEPVVDHNRWNSSEGVYTLSSGAPGYVKAIKNAQGKVVAVRKAVGKNNELYANNIYSENMVTVTTGFCKKLDAQKLEDDAKKCQNFLGNLFKVYEDQATEENLKTLQDVAKLDGVAPIGGLDDLKRSFKQQSYVMKILESKSIIANIGYLAQKCGALKRYSTDEIPADTSVTPVESSVKASQK